MPSVSSVQTVKTNTCPHGLSPGACPICNPGGGGASRVKDSEATKRKVTEWSWMQCYIAGQTMKAQKHAREESRALFESQINFLRQLNQNITALTARIQNALSSIEKSLPPSLQALFSKISNKILTPLLRMLENLPKNLEKIERFLEDLRAKIVDVSQKLTALLGEIKNFVDEKLIKNLKKLTRKLWGFFIWEEDEEVLKDDETLEIFKSREFKKIKAVLKKLHRKVKDDKCNKAR